MPDATLGTLTVVRDSSQVRPAEVAAHPNRMALVTESGRVRVEVPLAPREIEYGGLPLDWASAERSGTTPLLLLKGASLRTMQFSFLITDKVDLYAPQTARIAAIQALARSTERVLVRYSGSEQGLWRITDLSLSSELRDPVRNEITRATVSITLTEASDPAPAVGPVSKPPPPAPPKPVARTYIVRKGDTLWAIARSFYGNGALYPRIFDANRDKIKNPNLIYPAQVFVIP
jgi:LysM repeat protein